MQYSFEMGSKLNIFGVLDRLVRQNKTFEDLNIFTTFWHFMDLIKWLAEKITVTSVDNKNLFVAAHLIRVGLIRTCLCSEFILYATNKLNKNTGILH